MEVRPRQRPRFGRHLFDDLGAAGDRADQLSTHALGVQGVVRRAIRRVSHQLPRLQAPLSQILKGRNDVAVRQRPSDLEQLLGRHHPLALEEPSQRLDLLGRQVGKIGQGAVLDLLSFPVALAEQERRPRGSIGDLGDIHAYKLSIPCKASYIPNTNAHYMTTQ